MFPTNHTYSLEVLDTPEATAQRILAEHGWTLCKGFRVGNIALLNVSSSPDNIHYHQEYAVMLIEEETETNFSGMYFESLTVTRMTPEKLAADLALYRTFEQDGIPFDYTWAHPLTVDKHPQGHCDLCR